MEQLPLWGDAPTASKKTIPLLSKSRFGAGLQCHKRLYLECYRRDLRDPIDPTTRALFDAGIKVGKVAQGRFPGGIVFSQGSMEHEDAVRGTSAALALPNTRALYEAAFTHDDVRVRVDILAAVGTGEWDLIEVKSSSGYREEYLSDIGIQLYVLEGSGLRVRRACLLHVNSQYVFEGGDYDLQRLFTLRDLTAEARAAQPEILRELETMRLPLWAADPPSIPVGSQCKRPYVCPFFKHCHDGGPEHPVEQLPRTSPKLIEALRAAAIDDIRNIPEDFDGLSDLHKRIRASVITGRVHSDPELRRALEKLERPVHFLDFETCNPALPLFKGTRPFQQIPFQWSDHVLHADGMLEHREYLHAASTDPREAVARTLLDALGRTGPIVVYSGFEERIIRSLAGDLPGLRAELLALVETRIVDLLELIRTHYYHPGFRGSFSIKGVLPALIADLDYEDLEIREGGQAAAAFAELFDAGTSQRRRDELRAALRAYCRRDTEAMVRLFHKLKEDE